jgi:hypothetical protein
VVIGALAIWAIVAAAFTVSGASRCACTAKPTARDPNWTPTPPPPVSPADAAARASKLAGMTLSAAPDWLSLDGRPISESSGNGAVAYVDGNSGAVLEVVFVDRLPISDSATLSASAAVSSADAFVSGGGANTTGNAPRTSLVHRAAVAYYDVMWTTTTVSVGSLAVTGRVLSPTASGGTAWEVLVNAMSGTVFAYRDLGSGLALTVPVVGHDMAVRLAAQSTYAAGTAPDPDQDGQILQPGLDQPWTWMVGFNDGVLIVDATSGEVSVAKWASS